jgi:hypothetical protein
MFDVAYIERWKIIYSMSHTIVHDLVLLVLGKIQNKHIKISLAIKY